METRTIIFIVIILIILYVLVRLLTQSTLSGLTSANVLQTIPASSLIKGQVPNSPNFTYSIWMYVEDWNYRYGEPKIVFARGTPSTDSQKVATISQPCPGVSLAPVENNLIIRTTYFGGLDSHNLAQEGENTEEDNVPVHECHVSNIPIQKWVNVLVSAYGRSLDIYIDGKLVRTCVLPGPVRVDKDANCFITPAGGFQGYTTKFQYFPNSSNPQQAWDIYADGMGNDWLSGLLRTRIKISISDNGEEAHSLTI